MRAFIDRWAKHRGVLVATLMFTYSSQSLLITASKRESGSFSYDASAAVFLAEVLKLIFALAMLPQETRSSLDPRKSLIFAVPAVLYMIQNRLVFEALRYLSPPEYQLLNNVKLFTTAITYRVIMRRELRVLQWLALALLGLGMSLASYSPTNERAQASEAASGQLWHGTVIMLVVSWCSALAGVLNEHLIKKSANNLEANVWLYSYGVLVGALQFCASGWGPLITLEGFTFVTWLIVVCNALLGQSIAFLFRYADSIVKIYGTCMAMGFTTLLSVLFFGFELRFPMVMGFFTSVISVCLYYLPHDVLLATDSQIVADLCGGQRSEVAEGRPAKNGKRS